MRNLELGEYNMILGVDWMKYNPILDYVQKQVTIHREEKPMFIQEIKSTASIHMLNGRKLQKMFEKKIITIVTQFFSIQAIRATSSK